MLYDINLTIEINFDEEFRIQRDGFKGAEYYDKQGLLSRITALKAIYERIGVRLFFSSSVDEYYLPEKSIYQNYVKLLKTVQINDVVVDLPYDPKISTEGVKSDFFYHRDNGLVGWNPFSKYAVSLVQDEKSAGIDSTSNDSNYKNL